MSKKVLGIAIISAAVLGGTAACSGSTTTSAPASYTHPSSNAAVGISAPIRNAASPTSAATSASTATANGAAGANATVAPGTYVAGAWLAPAQMPFYQAGVTDWAYNSYNTGTHLGGHVYALATGGFVVGCSDDMPGGNLTSLSTGLAGAQYQAFTGPNSDKILANGAIPAFTNQAAYFYGSAAQAEAAMGGLAADFAQCKARITGVDPTTGTSFVGGTQQTLGTPSAVGAQCWTVVAKSATSTGGETIHDCFVRSGNVVEEVHVEINEVATFNDENFPALDASLVPALQHDLAAYSA